MLAVIETHADALRPAVFFGLLALFVVLERVCPRRRRTQPLVGRWTTNLGLATIGTVLLALLPALSAVAAAQWAGAAGWGLFNLIAAPLWLEVLLTLVLLDLAIYGQHVATHKVPALWRLHRVHHADPDLDTTSGIRFHPIEILLSVAYKMAVVVLLGPAVAAVILYEAMLNAMALFNHACVRLPRRVDAVLRWAVVTPDVHRVHHSVHPDETDSNYGNTLTLWDRLFGTFVAQPRDGHEAMQLGLNTIAPKTANRLDRALTLPAAPLVPDVARR